MRNVNEMRKKHLFLLLSIIISIIMIGQLSVLGIHGDESTLLTLSKMLFKGQMIYRDFFTHHMPISYYLVAIFYMFGIQTKSGLRILFDLLQIGGMVFYYFYFKEKIKNKSIPILIIIMWIFSPLIYNNCVLADSIYACAMMGLFLFIYKNEKMEYTVIDQCIISFLTFIAAMSTHIAFYPLLLFYLYYIFVRVKLYIRIKNFKKEFIYDLRFALIVLTPFLILLLVYFALGIFDDFWEQAIIFNFKYYTKYTGEKTTLSLFTDNFSSFFLQTTTLIKNILTILNGDISPQLVFDVLLFGSFLYCAFQTIKRERGIFSLYLVFFVYLLFMRTGFHGVSFYYIVCFWMIEHISLQEKRTQYVLGLVIIAMIILSNNLIQYCKSGALKKDKSVTSPECIIDVVTGKDEKIWAFPYRTDLYVATGRLPAIGDIYYLPWQDDVPGKEKQVIEDLKRTQPLVIVVNRKESVWGHALEEYAAELLQFVSENYYQLEGLNDAVFFNKNKKELITNRLANNSEYLEYLVQKGAGQMEYGTVIGNILNDEIRQEIIAEYDNLCRLSIRIATYMKTITEGELVLEILDESGTVIRQSSVKMEEVKDNEVVIFDFLPLDNSMGKKYIFSIYRREGFSDSIAIYASERDVLENCNTFLNRNRIEQDIWFIDYYRN